jgi:antitoxin StbD
MGKILAPTSVGLSELKANPTAVLEASGDQPVAILNGSKPVGYMLAAAREKIHNLPGVKTAGLGGGVDL